MASSRQFVHSKVVQLVHALVTLVYLYTARHPIPSAVIITEVQEEHAFPIVKRELVPFYLIDDDFGNYYVTQIGVTVTL